jgi:hypothetical protein
VISQTKKLDPGGAGLGIFDHALKILFREISDLLTS